jgi:predicted nucleic acid-binding protein
MNLYAESSAVLGWLLGEARGTQVEQLLEPAEIVSCSDLTLIECGRVLIRATYSGRLSETEAADCQRQLSAAAHKWNVFRIDDEIVERVQRPFPKEPIRSLDAIHLASALVARTIIPHLEVLSLDARLRNSAHDLGFKLQPQLV